MTLAPKQQRFVEEYLLDLNGKQAAIRAGYSPNCAEVTASRLLRNIKVAAAAGEARRERAERTAITQDSVIQALACIAFSDIRELFDEQGQLVPPHRLPHHVAGAVASITTGDGSSSVRIRMSNKLRALALLGKHLGLFKGQAPPQPQMIMDAATLAKMSDEDLQRIVDLNDTMQAIIAGADRR